MTDSSGRFLIKGIGRERVASLLIEGSTIETAHVKVRTRAGATIVVPLRDGTTANPTPVYGSAFRTCGWTHAPHRGICAG